MSGANETLPRDYAATVREANFGDRSMYVRLVYSEALPSNDRRLGQALPIARGAAGLTVGRDPAPKPSGQTLALPFDTWSSREHAKLTLLTTGDSRGLLVADLGSRNGSFLNAERVTGTALARDGDVVRVGSTLLVVGDAPLERARAILAAAPPPAGFRLASWPMVELWERLGRLAAGGQGVLLLGEMGTGKTRLARQLHRLSGARNDPFVSFNCSAIPHNLEEATLFGVVGGFIPTVKEKRGWIDLAGRGTLFLDELADMPQLAQAKLLDAFDPTEPSYVPVGGTRRLRTKCRLVSATNRDVFALCESGVIRQDLLSRLVSAQVTVPPLRERREDLLAIFADALVRHGGPRDGAQPEPAKAEVAEAMLLAHWTENVRGLESLAAQVAAGEPLSRSMVRTHADRGAAPRDEAPSVGPPVAGPPTPAAPPAWPPTAQELLPLLETKGWSVKAAAETLGKRPETLSRLLAKRFGGRAGAQRAHRVFRESGRMPAADQIDRAFRLFCEEAPTEPVLAARSAWTRDGTLP